MGQITTFKSGASRYIGPSSAGPSRDVSGSPELRAQANLGREIASLGGDLLNSIMQTDVIKGKARYEQAFTDFLSGLKTDTDFATYGQKFEQFTKSIRSELMKNQLGPAQRELDKFLTTSYANDYRSISQIAQLKQNDNMIATSMAAVETFERSGNVDEAVKTLEALRGRVSDVDLQKEISSVRRNTDYYRAVQQIDSDPGGFLKDIDSYKYLDPDVKIRLKNSTANKLDSLKETNYKDFMSQIWNGELNDINKVRQAWLSGEIDETQKNNLEKMIATPNSNENDSIALADMYQVMKSDMTQQQKFDKLIELKPKLKSTTADGFIKDIYDPAQVKKQTVKTYTELLAKMRTDGDLGENKNESALKFNLNYEEIERFDKENPDANPNQWSTFWDGLMADTSMGKWDKFMLWIAKQGVSHVQRNYPGVLKEKKTNKRLPGETIAEFLERTE